MIRSSDHVIAETRAWVQRAVIGLDLCPFAKAPFAKGLVRFVVCEAERSGRSARRAPPRDATPVQSAPEVLETTLVIHPHVLTDFARLQRFLDLADGAIEAEGCAGVIQVASFHPHYRFAGTAADDPATRPTDRLIRHCICCARPASIVRWRQAETIFEANIRTLEALGAEGWAALQARCRDDAAAA